MAGVFKVIISAMLRRENRNIRVTFWKRCIWIALGLNITTQCSEEFPSSSLPSFQRKILLHKLPPGFCDLFQVKEASALATFSAMHSGRVILHNKSGLSVYYNIRYRAGRRCRLRRPAGHGLEHDVREAFGIGGEDKEPEVVQVGGEVIVGSAPGRSTRVVSPSSCREATIESASCPSPPMSTRRSGGC